MAKDRADDRHKAKWHTQVRDIPPDVWGRVRAGASSRYVEDDGRTRPLNVGEYLTRCVQMTEVVRDAAEECDTTDEFYSRCIEALKHLGLEAVRA